MAGKTKVTAEPGSNEIHITRLFDAPREKVWRALTDPKLIPQWWGPAKYQTTIVKHEPVSGGSWRFTQRDDSGQEFGFHGVYHDMTAPERSIETFEFEGMPGHVALDSLTLADQDGKTLMTVVSVYQSVADRDGMVQSGMEQGVSEGHDRLDALLAKL
jgi:uncharacterized protein YndB with AHSA1/START domain